MCSTDSYDQPSSHTTGRPIRVAVLTVTGRGTDGICAVTLQTAEVCTVFHNAARSIEGRAEVMERTMDREREKEEGFWSRKKSSAEQSRRRADGGEEQSDINGKRIRPSVFQSCM